MDKIIKQSIKYLQEVPKEYQSEAFPLILAHLLLDARRQERLDNKRK